MMKLIVRMLFIPFVNSADIAWANLLLNAKIKICLLNAELLKTLVIGIIENRDRILQANHPPDEDYLHSTHDKQNKFTVIL